MSTADFIGLSLGVVIALLALLKMELLKGLVKRITGRENSIFMIIVLLIVVACLPILITHFLIPQEEDTNDEKIKGEKSEFESYVDAGEDVIDYSIDLGKSIKENQDRKDSIYQANREVRWVYQIGDMVEDVDILENTYNSCSHLENINVFKVDRKKHFLFKEMFWSEKTMRDSLEGLIMKLDHPEIKVRIVDIVAHCNRKEEVTITKEVKFGKFSKKIFVPCYECNK